MHYAVTGKTAAEIIAGRANSKKEMIGLTNISGMNLIHRDIYIAKNYLNEKELNNLNRIVDAYLSFAEIQAQGEIAMNMKDWINKLDEYLALLGKGILHNAGSVSTEDAQAKADQEYEVFKKEMQSRYLSDFDRTVKQLEQKAPKRRKKNG